MEAKRPPAGLDQKRRELRSRLARAHGHLHGVLDMIDAGRDNDDILHQVNAVRAALDRANRILLDDILSQATGRLEGAPREAIERLRSAIRALG
jgi:uncharacterized protein